MIIFSRPQDFLLKLHQLPDLGADVATHRPTDIRPVLASYKGHDIAKEFIERSKEVQK